MGIKDFYLILYNSLCCGGWAAVVLFALQSLATNLNDGMALADALASVYDNVDTMLNLSQSAALLEIVHAAIGLVRSPVSVTFMQVMSRIVALVAIVYSPQAQSKFIEMTT